MLSSLSELQNPWHIYVGKGLEECFTQSLVYPALHMFLCYGHLSNTIYVPFWFVVEQAGAKRGTLCAQSNTC